MTPLQGSGMGKTTNPAQAGMTHGVTTGGTGAVTKEFVIQGREAMMEEMTRLEMEMRHYEILLKRAKVEAMKVELEKLSPKKTFLNDISDKRGGDGQVDRARRREMLKIIVPELKRGDADEVLNSTANFNTVLRACGLEAVAYLDENGSTEEEADLGTLVQRLVSKDFFIVASVRAEFGERGGLGSEIMQHLRDYFVNPLVYESTDAETELLKINWKKLMEGDGTAIKADLKKVWAIIKLMPKVEKEPKLAGSSMSSAARRRRF